MFVFLKFKPENYLQFIKNVSNEHILIFLYKGTV